MTLTTAVDRTQTSGNGSLIIFPYNFKIWASDEIEVILSNKVVPLDKDTLTIITDYTVQDVGEATGGTITLQGTYAATPPTSDQNITILRKLEYKQEVGVTNQGGFKGNTHETAWDKLVALIQQLKGTVDRCFQVDEVSMADTADLTYETMLARSPTLLDVATGTGVASLTVVGDISDYEQCWIELNDLVPAVDAADLQMEISEDGGSTWITEAPTVNFKAVWHGYEASIGVRSGSGSSTNKFTMWSSGGAQSFDADAGLYGNLYCSATAALSFSYMGMVRFEGSAGSGETMLNLSGRILSSAYTVNAIRFTYHNGNIASGTVRLWGMPTGE